MTYLGKNLRHLAARAGIKQAALGEKLGVEQSTVQRIMSGKTEYPRLDSLLAVSKFFGYSIDALVHRDLQTEDVEPSQPVGRDDANMAQAVELLHIMAAHRPDDRRFRRISWNAILVAEKVISRVEELGETDEEATRIAVRMILEELNEEV